MLPEHHIVIRSVYDALLSNTDSLFDSISDSKEQRNLLYKNNHLFGGSSIDYLYHASYQEGLLKMLFLDPPSTILSSKKCLLSSFFYLDYFSSYLSFNEKMTEDVAFELKDERKRVNQIIRLSDGFRISNTNVKTARYSMVERTKDLIVDITNVFQKIEF